jgi:hypothetical protein
MTAFLNEYSSESHREKTGSECKMDDEFLSLALKNTIDEMQKTCPEVKTAFALDAKHELIAQGENTPESTVVRATEILREVMKKAEVLGGADDLTIKGTDGRVNVSRMDEIYVVTVASKNADLKYVDTVVHVLFPTVLKVLEKLGPAPVLRKPSELEPEPELAESHEEERSVEPTIEETDEETKAEISEELEGKEASEGHEEDKNSLPEPEVNQFIVEDIKGLLTPSDTVRIDGCVIEHWKELYEGKNLEEADLETFAGKSLRCKVKPIKDAKLEGQGKIQIPIKLQDVLDIKKGELVRVKPAIE